MDKFAENPEHKAYYALQQELAQQVIEQNSLPQSIKTIAGADVAYCDESAQQVGAFVVLDATTGDILEQTTAIEAAAFPYIPGLFSFREIPVLQKAYKQLRHKPDLLICDGHGIAHPRGLGMASHFGVLENIPTIGCAKKHFFGTYDRSILADERGAVQYIKNGPKTIAAAVRTQSGVKPVFVSTGHKIHLDTAVEWVLKMAHKYRQPQTTRFADKLVNETLKALKTKLKNNI